MGLVVGDIAGFKVRGETQAQRIISHRLKIYSEVLIIQILFAVLVSQMLLSIQSSEREM